MAGVVVKLWPGYTGFQRDDFTGEVVLDWSDGKFRLKGRSNFQGVFLFSESEFS